MTVYRPLYYKEFKCIADKCRHSCCVGWEISVDEDSLNRYEALGIEDILCHIEDGEIRLCDDRRCPFLNEGGLCEIISDLGEEYTSLICREHPRFYHRIGDRVEGGIGLSCEEACRIILSSDLYAEFCSFEHYPDVAEETDFDSIVYRNEIYDILADKSMTYREKISHIKEKFGLSCIHSLDGWNEIFSRLEYLEEGHRDVLHLREGSGEYYDIYLRFFAYLVFRHLSVAEGYENLRARLGFCLLLTRLFEGLTAERELGFSEICELARIISEEIEYSEDNTASLIFEFECSI